MPVTNPGLRRGTPTPPVKVGLVGSKTEKAKIKGVEKSE
jgi:hypothetical protein